MKHSSVVFMTLLAILPCRAGASSVDNSGALICAVVDLASCSPGSECQRETAASMNVPELIVVDPNSHEITGRRPNGQPLATRIDRMTRAADLSVFEGVQDGLSWTLTTTQHTGQMSLAAVGHSVAFLAFGRCMQK